MTRKNIVRTVRAAAGMGAALALLAGLALAQGLTPSQIQNPSPKTWPTYHGDYSGRHYSSLDQINRSNVDRLTRLWSTTLTAQDYGNVGGVHKPGAPIWMMRGSDAVDIKSEPLVVNGVIYLSSPDRAWAIDVRTGRELWHYFWHTSGGSHIGNRGMAMYGNWLYFETPDCYLVSLNAKTGQERWHKKIANVRQYYFCTSAPTIVKNHVIAGVSGDSADLQGFLKSFDPVTGNLQWIWYTTPQKPGDPGYNSWPNQYARTHGGGMTWQEPTYDPELNLLYVPTGNPNPVGAPQSRPGDNLFTCSLVALNPDTGKMVWYYQTSPHDTHDWDSTEVPVLINAMWHGKPRKLVVQATRNGYFFVLDRVTGQHLLTTPLVDPQFITWSKGLNADGQPVSNPAKNPSKGGVLVGPGSATNWPPPSYSPESGLFYVGTSEALSMEYLTDPSARPEGYGFSSGGGVVRGRSGLRAIDLQTGKMKWFHAGGGPQGLLTTAGHLLFGSDGQGNLIAFDQDTGKILWHTALGRGPTNAPETFMLDGRQVILVPAGTKLYLFALAGH